MSREQLQIRLPSATLGETVRSPEATSVFRNARTKIFNSYGVLPPAISLLSDDSLPDGGYIFSFDGLSTQSAIGPGEGEFSSFGGVGPAADATGEDDLASAGTGRVSALGEVFMVFPESRRSAAEARGMSALDWLGHLGQELEAVCNRWVASFQDEDSTGMLFEGLAAERPALAEAARRLPAGIIHSTVRALLADRIPIANFPRIVQLALRFDDVRSPDQDRLAYIRQGLAYEIASTISNDSDVAVVYLLAAGLENDAGALGPALDAELQVLPRGAMVPAILTTDQSRALVAQTLRESHPGIRVVGFGELPPHWKVQPSARIGA